MGKVENLMNGSQGYCLQYSTQYRKHLFAKVKETAKINEVSHRSENFQAHINKISRAKLSKSKKTSIKKIDVEERLNSIWDSQRSRERKKDFTRKLDEIDIPFIDSDLPSTSNEHISNKTMQNKNGHTMSLAPAEAKCQRVVFAAVLWHHGAVSAVQKCYHDNKMEVVKKVWRFLGSY